MVFAKVYGWWVIMSIEAECEPGHTFRLMKAALILTPVRAQTYPEGARRGLAGFVLCHGGR